MNVHRQGIARLLVAVLAIALGAALTTVAAPAQARGKVAYLTLDDGPSRHTPAVLKVLRKQGATATFFQLGSERRRYPRAAAAIRRQGSNIGNHTYGHRKLTSLSSAAVRREVRGGPPSRCVRPPYGATNARVRTVIASMGKRSVLWSADSRDWTRPGVDAIVRNSLKGLHNGSIILMHDGGGDRSQTVRALPKLITALKKRGYAVRALPSC